MKKQNPVVETLLFARSHPKGFVMSELEQFFQDAGLELNSVTEFFGQGEKYLFNQIGGRGKDNLYNLSLKGVEMLVQIDSAQAAVDSAVSAKFSRNIAILSIMVSIAAAIASSFLGAYFSSYFKTEIRLDESQLEKLTNNNVGELGQEATPQ